MKPLKKAFWFYVILLFTIGSAFAANPRPNILFIFSDDQRADTIAALGNSHIQTPNLDRLVHSGLTFNRAYLQGAMNSATCIPSRAMLLSGRSVLRIDDKLLRDETWPAAFGRAGYTTFMTGKWHNDKTVVWSKFRNGPWPGEESSIAKSFQSARSVFIGGMANPTNAPLCDLSNGQLSGRRTNSQHSVATFADEAIHFLNEPQAAPFFCYVAFNAPHDPHIVPEDFPVRYDPAQLPLPSNFLPQHPWDNGDMMNRDETLLPWPRPPEQVRAFLAEYYRYVSYLDAQVGRVLEALRASPYATNTIVVFSSDSGVARGSHGLIGKQSVYEHSLRVPLILSGPGLPAGQQTEAMCYLFDVMPTLGKLCEVAAPPTNEGIAFTRALKNAKKPARQELFFAYLGSQRAVRDDRWKLIRYPLINRTQLFDLKNDPQETHNLADDPKHATQGVRLMKLLAQKQKEFGDTLPLTAANPKPAEWSPPQPKESAK